METQEALLQPEAGHQGIDPTVAAALTTLQQFRQLHNFFPHRVDARLDFTAEPLWPQD